MFDKLFIQYYALNLNLTVFWFWYVYTHLSIHWFTNHQLFCSKMYRRFPCLSHCWGLKISLFWTYFNNMEITYLVHSVPVIKNNVKTPGKRVDSKRNKYQYAKNSLRSFLLIGSIFLVFIAKSKEFCATGVHLWKWFAKLSFSKLH